MTAGSRLTSREWLAMAVFKRLAADGQGIGRRKIVSMQRLEEVGLVKRITRNGMIADWELTEAGKGWQE